MKYIDARCRPPYKSFTDNPAGFFKQGDRIVHSEKFAKACGLKVADSVRHASMDEFVQEMDDANIGIGFASPRRVWGVSNDDLAPLLEDYPDRFKTFANILTTSPIEESLAEIDKYVSNGTCTGIYMEPAHAMNTEQMFVNDERIFPIYEKCEKEDIPVLLGFGGFIGGDYIWSEPKTVLEVVSTFPNLHLMLEHGGWPFVREYCHMAYKHTNLYIEPDLYSFHTIGSRDLIEAANYLIPENFVFGTAYPMADMVMQARMIERLIDPQNFENVMYGNAMRFLTY